MSETIEIKCIECTFSKNRMGKVCPLRMTEITETGKCVLGGSLSRIGKPQNDTSIFKSKKPKR